MAVLLILKLVKELPLSVADGEKEPRRGKLPA